MKKQKITYSWKLISLKKTNTPDLDNVIVQVLWNKIGVDANGNSGVYLGVTPFDLSTVDPNNFVSYSDLTEEIVLGWVKSIVVDGYEENVNSAIEKQIQDKLCPIVEVTGGFPWTPSPEITEPVGVSTLEPIGIATVGISTSEPVGIATTEPVGIATTS